MNAPALERPPVWPPDTENWRLCAPRPTDKQIRYICKETGIRFYAVPDEAGKILGVPGVTSILSDDSPAEEKERLINWRKREIEAGRDPDAGRNRGSAVHTLLEDFIRGDRTLKDLKTSGEHTEITAYASGMEKFLTKFDSFLWSERPLRNGWNHTWSHRDKDGKRIARVWNTTWGFAGTPDLIATRDGKNILADFKTSKVPYYRPNGSAVPGYQRLGYLKYIKTVRQLCAYELAIESTLGIKIDGIEIYVGLPGVEDAQCFEITRIEHNRETENFKLACRRFWERRLALYNQEAA